MENKINLVEILKDCPIGTKLYSPLCGECKLDTVTCKSILVESITFKTLHFNEDGTYYEGYDDAECLLFPSKENRDWSKLQRPFKDGDVVTGENCACSYIAIFKEFIDDTSFSHHACLTSFGKFSVDDISDNANLRLATPKENEKLFDAINDKGYRWNDETKTLDKWIEPKFKVGDKVQNKNSNMIGIINLIINDEHEYQVALKNGGITYMLFEYQDDWELVPNIKPKFKVGDRIKAISNSDQLCQYLIIGITDTHYTIEEVEAKFKYAEPIDNDKNWELVTNKFDINTLKPFESRVLVRNSDNGFWQPTFWGVYEAEKANEHHYRNYLTTKGFFRHCIPYNDDTKHLIGTTNDCDNYYKNW